MALLLLIVVVVAAVVVAVVAGVVALSLLWNMLMALMVSPPPRELRINVVMQSKQQTAAVSKLALTTPTIASMHETPVMEVAAVVFFVVMCQGYNNNVQ